MSALIYMSILSHWIFFFLFFPLGSAALLLSEKSYLHLDTPNWELPVTYSCFGKISKSDSSHGRHYKSLVVFVYLIFYPFACYDRCSAVVVLQWNCSGFSLSVTEKDLEDSFLAVWPMDFLTDHYDCFSFKEKWTPVAGFVPGKALLLRCAQGVSQQHGSSASSPSSQTRW